MQERSFSELCFCFKVLCNLDVTKDIVLRRAAVECIASECCYLICFIFKDCVMCICACSFHT